MTATNDLLPFATGLGANVDTQADWAANPSRLLGFVAGTARSALVNKAIRQAAFVAAMIGQFTADKSGQNTVDDGNVATFEANFLFALNAVIGTYITNNSGSLSALSTPNDFLNAGTMAGSANAIAATCAPTCAAPPHTGAILIGVIGTTNTAVDVTLKADSAAAIAVYLPDGATKPGIGALQSGHTVMFRFNGTYWLALFDFTIGAIIGSGASTPYLPLAGGTTTGLVNLTGGYTVGYRVLTANTTLAGTNPNCDLGKFIELSGSTGFTTTLPAATGLKGEFTIWNASSVAQTLGGAGTTFVGPKGSGVGTLVLQSGTVVRLISDGTSWVVSGYVDTSSVFPANAAGALTNDGSGNLSWDAITHAFSANGYQRLPGGLILQWCTGTAVTGASTVNQTVTFPIAFPNACLFVSASKKAIGTGNAGDFFFETVSFNASSAVIMFQSIQNNTTDQGAPLVFAIGY